jgi:hypothetical protein
MILFMWLTAMLYPARTPAQDFRSEAVPVTQQVITCKLRTPIAHLSVSPYVPSRTTTFVGPTTFWFYTRPLASIFLQLQWDMDASDGVTFSDWYTNIDNPAVVTQTYATPGFKTITVHIQMYNTAGQRQDETKTIEIFVAPAPTATYADTHGNVLYYWEGMDGAYDKPVLNVEGFDPTNETDPLGNYAQGYSLVEEARAEGFDLLFLNFADGGADLSVNKDVFLGACKFAHSKLGDKAGAVQVVGVSMGGAIARYGLAWAEEKTKRGSPVDHYVNTFISFDAPQQGAHLNYGLQALLRNEGTAAQQLTLQSAAAKQLLYQDVYGSLHDNLFTTMNNLNPHEDGSAHGYPEMCRNYAISNGNYTAVYPDKVPGVDPLATLTIYKEATIMFYDIDELVIDEVVKIPSELRDLWPGSTFTNDLRKINKSGNNRDAKWGFPWNLLFSGFGHWEFNVNFNPSYQPTESALDLTGYYRTPDGSLVGGTTFFDETVVQAVTHRHEELTDDSRTKILAWLNGNRTYAYLSKPQNVRAAVIDGNAIQVSFTNASIYNDGVTVERKQEGGSYVKIATVRPGVSSYADRDPALVPFTSYIYRVRSVAGTRASLVSDDVAVFYQPHLASSTSAALGGGSQRKALQTTAPYSNRFMAYESAGGSYLVQYVSSDAATGAWDMERPIGGVPTAALQYRSPSLFPDSSGAVPQVIFDEVNTALGTHTIRRAAFDAAAQSVATAAEPLATLPASAGFAPMAVAATTDAVPAKPASLLAAAWRYELNNGLGLGVGVYDSGGQFRWSTVDLNGGVLSGLAAFAANPTIAAVLQRSGNPPAYHVYLAWEEENHGGTLGGIRLLHGRYTPGSQPWPPAAQQIVWESGAPMVVAQNTSSETHRRPAIAVDSTGSVTIAWESAASASGKILVQKRDGLTSTLVTGATAAIATGSGTAAPHDVSIAEYRTVPGAGDNLAVAWSSDAGGMSAAWYVASARSWSAPRLLDASARQPSLAVTKSASPESRLVAASDPSGPPYAIRALSAGLLPPPPPAPSLSWQTVLVNNVKRPKLTWTAVGPDLQAYELYMYTCDAAEGDCGATAYHALQTATTGLTYTDLNTVVFTKTSTSLAADRTNFYYVRARDRFSQRGAPSAKAAVNTAEQVVWKPSAGGDREVPAEFALSGNYPNPFNPSTAFRYQLPVSGDVRIVIYNMIGEEVMTLVDQAQEAGTYEAVWDASASPSGVYAAVMRVTGARGAPVYTAVKKALLVR